MVDSIALELIRYWKYQLKILKLHIDKRKDNIADVGLGDHHGKPSRIIRRERARKSECCHRKTELPDTKKRQAYNG
jgi:hypothetical protein